MAIGQSRLAITYLSRRGVIHFEPWEIFSPQKREVPINFYDFALGQVDQAINHATL